MKRIIYLLLAFISSLQATSQAPTNGLVAYYPFNGNANDAVGTNHGISSGVTYPISGKGLCARVNGGNISIPQLITNSMNSFSISIWVNEINMLDNDGEGYIFFGDHSTCGWVGIFHGDVDRPDAKIYFSVNGVNTLSINPPVNYKNSWVNYQLVYSNENLKGYVNGVLVGQQNVGSIKVCNSNATIGKHWWLGGGAYSSRFNGYFDDIRIYNRALTDIEVNAVYQAEMPKVVDLTTGLVGHYKMDGNAYDASGNGNHGNPVGGVNFNTSDRFGIVGKAVEFDGVDDYFNTNLSQYNLFEYTVTTWFNTMDNDFTLIQNRGPVLQGGRSLTLRYWEGKFGIACDGDYIFIGKAYNYVPNNQWTHIAVSWSGNGKGIFEPNQFKIYINGEIQQNTIEYNIGQSNIPLIPNGTVKIGMHEAFQNFYNGMLDDFRIYNRTLSDAEVFALYMSENSSISLTTALRFGGGQTILSVGTNYNVTAAIKNNSSSSWVGDVYLKVKGGTPTLISSNNVISAGGTYNISSTFTPQISQIGTGVTMELLTKQGTNDFVRVATVNGTVNPVVVNIEAINPNPVVKIPFIRLNQSEVSPGGTVQIVGGNFEPNTNVTIGSYPNITGATYPNPSVNADGSILTTFTIPNTFTDRYLTIYGRDTKSNNPGASLIVNQPQEVAVLKITKPYKENETINITPNGTVAIQFSDKLLKGTIYPQNEASRSYRYEIGYQLSGSTVFNSLFQTPIKSDLVNKEINETILVAMIGSNFSTPSNSGGWPLKFIIKDMYNNQRVAETPIVNINVVQDISKISLKWDRSFTPIPSQDPIGIAADGVARMYFVVEKNNPTSGSAIQSVSISLSNYESNQDPINFNNGTWLGRVMYATQQNNNQYSEEANNISSIVAQSNGVNTDGKYWFWYVAPDDFMRDGLPSPSNYANESEREVTARFTIIYADGSTEIISKEIKIVRPPLMLVHGLNGSEKSWSKSHFALFSSIKDRFKLIKFAKISPKESFIVNANGLLGKFSIGEAISFDIDPLSSFPNVIQDMRLMTQYACSQVDYVAHSMGGCVLRMAEQQTNDFYIGGNTTRNYKNYNKGYVHKFISVNTPHEGSPLADLLSDGIPFLPLEATYIMTTLTNISYGVTGGDYTWWSNFITPSTDYKGRLTESLQYINAVPYDFETTRAIKNMEVMNGGNGIRFKQTNLKSHLISGDVVSGTTDLIPNYGNFIMSDPYYKKFFEYLETAFEFLKFDKQVEQPRPWFMDFIYFTKQNVPAFWEQVWESNEKLTNIDKLYAVTKTMKQLGLWLGNYDDFAYNGDWVVPLKSQIANMGNSSNLSILNNSNIDFGKNHLFITDDMQANNRINELLNKSVNSNLFGSISASQTINRPSSAISFQNKPSVNYANGIKTTSLNGLTIQDKIDTTKIRIIAPVNNSIIKTNDILKVLVRLKDTTNLKGIGVSFQDEAKNDTLNKNNINQTYEFQFSVKEITLNKNYIIAYARYFKSDTIFYARDTISVEILSNESLTRFKVFPKIKEINLDAKFVPQYELSYSSFTNNLVDKSKLTMTITNPACLSYNTQTGQFKGLQKGETAVYFTYDGIFKDTMYVAVGGGGLPYPQTITTSSSPSTTVCTGQTISVPFTTAGGSFEADNLFFVQISDKNGENFKTIASGGTSPISIKIPNDLQAGVGYKIRVVSTNVPVVGSNSPTILTITAFGTPPTISANKSTFWNGDNVTLTASACPSGQTLKWSDGSASNLITITPTESVTYTAVCTNGTCETANSTPVYISKNFCPVDYTRNTSVSSGDYTFKASNSIQATNKISGIGTKETLEAKSITLNPGFEANQGVIFKVIIGGCAN